MPHSSDQYWTQFVRDHEHTNDAQAVFKSFVEHYTGLDIADLDQAQLMEYVTTICLGESGPWKGTYYSFVLHFQEQLRKLDDLQDDPGAHFSPEMRKILLQNVRMRQCNRQYDSASR